VPVFKAAQCGKAEEGSGKKGSGLLRFASREALVRQERSAGGFTHYSGSKLAGPFAGGMEDTNQMHNIAAHTIRNYVRRSRDD
jgi:hypothetical protein